MPSMRFRSTLLLSWRAQQLGAIERLESAKSYIPYVICTNPRCGSYLFFDGLASTRLTGRPREWFNPLGQERRRSRWGLDKSAGATYASNLNQVRVQNTTRNRISGIKLHYYGKTTH